MSMTVGVSSLTLKMLSNIAQLDEQMNTTMTRLSTGKRINSAKDDPSGLVALTGMNSDMAAVNAALTSNQRSQAVLDVADTTLVEVGNLTTEIERLAVAAADPNATASEVAAYQASIDQHLDTIDSLISNSEFSGTKLFTGDNAIAAADSGNGNLQDIHVYSVDPEETANKTMVVDATTLTAVTVDGNAATAEVIKLDDGSDSNFARIHYTNGGYSLSFVLDTTTAQATDALTITIGTGATFQLGTDSSTQAVLDLGAGVTTSELGAGVLDTAGTALAGYLSSLRSGGTNSLTATDTRAAEIAEAANQQVALAAARVGNFNKFQVGSSIAALEAMQQGLSDAISVVQDTDYAAETAALDRQQILMNAAVSLLGVANSQQSNVLALL